MTAVDYLPVFVYGTLRPGGANYRGYLAGRTQKEQPASMSGLLFLVVADDYPYLTDGPGCVVGTLVTLRPECYRACLDELDRLEEFDPRQPTASLYLRRRAKVALVDGTPCQAWVYYWNGPAIGMPLPGGDFFAAAQRNEQMYSAIPSSTATSNEESPGTSKPLPAP